MRHGGGESTSWMERRTDGVMIVLNIDKMKKMNVMSRVELSGVRAPLHINFDG